MVAAFVYTEKGVEEKVNLSTVYDGNCKTGENAMGIPNFLKIKEIRPGEGYSNEELAKLSKLPWRNVQAS
jgi:hypothetical protein